MGAIITDKETEAQRDLVTYSRVHANKCQSEDLNSHLRWTIIYLFVMQLLSKCSSFIHSTNIFQVPTECQASYQAL